MTKTENIGPEENEFNSITTARLHRKQKGSFYNDDNIDREDNIDSKDCIDNLDQHQIKYKYQNKT
jgi:hypothetical protein